MMKNKITKSFVLLLLLGTFAFGQDKVKILDKYIEVARKNWQVPGMSVTVVRDRQVLLSKGYGVRESGKAAAVDASTLFGAMSTTKAMTAVAMGILVDEGKVGWDDKVTKHLPDFRVADSYVTGEIRVRDLFTHNAGLPNADFLWTRDELSSDGIVSRMQYAKPSYPFRAGFVYHNVMYLVAGKIIEKASGMTWERFMTERVFNPLGMKNTFPTLESSRAYQNRSAPHFEIKNQITVIPEMAVDTAGPAGSVWSTADDIGKWINFTLYNTTADGKPLLRPATFNELFKPQVILPTMFYPTFRLTKPHWTTYGLGWFQHDYRGEMVNFHTGSLAGRTAIIGLLRDKKLGVYIFGNLDHAELRHALMYKVFDLFAFDDNRRDWSAEMKVLYDGIKAEAAKAREASRAARQTNTKPTLPLDAYAGKYFDPYYGSIELQMVEGKLRAIINRETYADLEHWEKDSFLAKSNKAWQGEGVIRFEVKPDTKEVELIWGSQRFKRQVKP
ncbi:MAG: serine hydrolase [Acidobacteria bacterium]|nr:serine hydrolase [Acidobacteriota bacterium]MCA1639566.1 serine hydrolase [Acidobacteriota bacterium]